MLGLGLLPPVQLFVVVDVAEVDSEAGVALEMARGIVDDGKSARSGRAAVEWLGAVLPRITPRGSRVQVLGPTGGGMELLGLRTRPTAVTRGRIVVTTIALQDECTAPGDPAPPWLVLGLLRAGGRQGTRALSLSRAGNLYVRFAPS